MEALNRQPRKSKPLSLFLPFPPSVNHYWRMVTSPHGCRLVISREGRAYRLFVGSILAAAGRQPMTGRLKVTVTAYPPDRRTRDLDNLQKALLDALEHGGAIENDGHIDDLHIVRGEVRTGGEVQLTIEQLEQETQT